MSNRQIRITFPAVLFLTGLLVVCLIALFPGIDIVKAQSVNRNTSATSVNTWTETSFPVENFQAYTSGFGYRRSPNNPRSVQFHNGLDIAAPKGSYIRNWFTGTVIQIGDRGACGTYMIIESGDWQHSYCHMQGSVAKLDGDFYMIDREGGIKIAKGQQIPSGSRIGRIGMTGRTTGPHLHWVLRYKGEYVDPGLVLRQMYAAQSDNIPRT
ncbi:M23 family metallopeptidase [Rivularia sp. UHCC 0363]|uniref:M23 family metallopeptidase n=1 Tax=Rivularia sp. UHCC 0363 TaxID=3110244 RepID=UPI002B212D53|nr:M23 family metallopeptidase [Rivularia sp. UHCC 0363]MEA5597792.1 M23 family metallopeptidase [Rivularia sp. UHCC 0363]